MIFYKSQALSFKSLITNAAFSLLGAATVLAALTSCVKPQNHESSSDNSASFYLDKMEDPKVDTDSLFKGYSLPKSKRFTFTACAKDRRTDESLAGTPFEIAGGPKTVELTSNEKGCLVWTETLEFDYLSNEKYLPLERSVTAKGAQVGSRKIRMALNPWKLNDRSSLFKDRNDSEPPAKQIATPEQLSQATKPDLAGSTLRYLQLGKIAIVNSLSSATNEQQTRSLKFEIEPRLSLTDIDGNPASVNFTADDEALSLQIALVEILKNEKNESVRRFHDVSRIVPVRVGGGKLSAEVPLMIPAGATEASRFMLAVKVAPQSESAQHVKFEVPRGLQAFEGLYAIGDLHSLTEAGPLAAELKDSNAEGSFKFEADQKTAGNSADSSSDSSSDSSKKNFISEPIATKPSQEKSTLFRISTITPSWSGLVDEDVANHRTVMYSVRACFKDLTNGGKSAVNETFTVTLADGKTKKHPVAYEKDDKVGCIDWEDTIKHRYFAPEKWFKIPVTITHKSGYQMKSEYVIAPWTAWGFTQDTDAKPGFIEMINSRKPIPSRLLADAVEFNTGINANCIYCYEVDDYLSMQMVKRVVLRIPMRIFRPSNIRDGANISPEAARTGKYLLKAAFVAPIQGVGQKLAQMLVSPMRGLTRVVDVRGGELKAEVDFPVNDVRLLNARSYLVFEVKVLDEEKIPKNDPYLRNSKKNLEDYVDREAGVIMPTYVAPLFLKNEKDSGVPVPVGDLSLDLPSTDAIDMIGKRGYTPTVLKDAIRPFANVTVEKLYATAKKDREEYRRRMDLEKSVGLFARRANAEFVSIFQEPKIVANDKLLTTNNEILPKAGKGINALLTILNQPLQKFGSDKILSLHAGVPQLKVTQATLVDFVKGEKPFDTRLAAQFCGYFFYHTPRTKTGGLKYLAVEADRGSWMDSCINQVLTKGPDSVFLRDRRIRAIEVNPVAKKIAPGRSMSFSIGADIGFSKSSSSGWGYGGSWGSSGLLGSISQLALVSKMSKTMKFFTSAPGLAGIGLDVSARRDRSNSIGTGTSFGSGTSLTMEQTELMIEMKRAEECVVIRPKAEFVESGLRMYALKKILGDNQAEHLMSRGLLICDGFAQPKQVSERYYTFGYEQPSANNLDPHAIENLPWILSLRGRRDYATFVLMTSSRNKTPAQVSKMDIDIGDLPLERLEQAYKMFYAGKTMSNPGFISTEPKIIPRANAK